MSAAFYRFWTSRVRPHAAPRALRLMLARLGAHCSAFTQGMAPLDASATLTRWPDSTRMRQMASSQSLQDWRRVRYAVSGRDGGSANQPQYLALLGSQSLSCIAHWLEEVPRHLHAAPISASVGGWCRGIAISRRRADVGERYRRTPKGTKHDTDFWLL